MFFSHLFCFTKAARLTTCECFLSSVLFFYIEVIKLVKVCGCFLSSVLFFYIEVIKLVKVCGCFLSSVLFCEGHQANHL